MKTYMELRYKFPILKVLTNVIFYDKFSPLCLKNKKYKRAQASCTSINGQKQNTDVLSLNTKMIDPIT